MDITKDIQSLTDFKRHTPEFLERLRDTGRPTILTVNGKAQLVVMDAAAYQEILEQKELVASVNAVNKSLHEFSDGKSIALDDSFKTLGNKYGFDDETI